MRSDKYCGRRLHREVVGIIGDAQGQLFKQANLALYSAKDSGKN